MTKTFLFVNENIFTFNSGTEFSAMNRQKLFKENKRSSKIVTRNYNQGLHQEIEKYGLDSDDVLNMYDYFQNVTDVPHKHAFLRYSDMVDKNEYKIDGVDNNKSYIEQKGKVVAQVNIFPLTVGEIGTVDYYDRFGNTSSRDVWDGRGFRSKTQYLHPDGQVGHEILFDYKGNAVMEITHMNINGQVHPTMFKLLNYKGHNRRFNTEDELFEFFLNEISDPKTTVLINDRPTLTEVVARVKNVAARYQFLHNEQTTDANLAGSAKGKLYPILETLFHKHLPDYDGLIVSTPQQRDDLSRLFPEIKTYAIFDTALFNDQEEKIRESLSDDRDNNVVYVGRIFHDKHIDQLLQIVSFAKNRVPNIHLDVVGYFESEEYRQELLELAKKLGLETNVDFKGYLVGKDKEAVLSQAKVMVQTSFGEGLSMSLVNGLEYGLAEVAYDVNYGPRNIIDNDVNGYLIPAGNVREAASHIDDILLDNKLFKKLSNGSLVKAKEFSSENVNKQWDQIDK
ncbi:glycosyltransferase [Lactobacillus sp. Sy-1]|uniref:glycosyltransferase n=1 Tax=Lactobacillus sp. Sy-1 TaxID=2109645 RepID=UPI001C57000E|nr:glycosyltransferase [Lactobacillus sp. Sy-1]MBW1605264.1 glycosyltransferase [Lactobacillus sp. Sy-1]